MKRYVFCGLSNRSFGMFIEPMLRKFSNKNEIVGLLDIDPLRFEVVKEKYLELQNVPT